MNDQWNVVLSRLLATMPQSVDERKILLTALVAVVPTKHPSHDAVRAVLRDLDMHIWRQRELALSIDKKEKKP